MTQGESYALLARNSIEGGAKSSMGRKREKIRGTRKEFYLEDASCRSLTAATQVDNDDDGTTGMALEPFARAGDSPFTSLCVWVE